MGNKILLSNMLSLTKEFRFWCGISMHIVFFIMIFILVYSLINQFKDNKKREQINFELSEDNKKYRKIIDKEKNKNDYFINLSHELRTPLNVILSTEQLITNLNSRDEHIDKDKLDYYMDILRSNSKRLLKLINDIIDSSKIESGEYKLNIGNHEIIYHIEEIVYSLKEYVNNKGITLIVDPEIEEKEIECDINDIEKCIINLLGNAIKFTPSGGTITINIYDLIEKIEISFTDTGIGIAENEMDNIFNRFEQAYNKKSEEFGGSGIGLALTKQLVELHNGELKVKSKMGVGSTFSIILPVHQENKLTV